MNRLYAEGLERIADRERLLRQLQEQRDEKAAAGIPTWPVDDEIRWQKMRIKQLRRALEMVW